jgi:hypothetical protein
MNTPNTSDEVPVPDASPATAVPKRTIYRWIGSGKLKARTVDGIQVVSLEAVRALAAARDATGERGSAAPRAGTSAGTGTPALLPAQDGALAARVFADLDEGKTPVEIVRERELPPRVVLELSKQHDELRSMRRPARASIADEIADLKEAFAALQSEVEVATQGGTLWSQFKGLAQRVDEIEALTRALPVPPRGAFTCQGCGATGWIAAHVRCTECGRDSTFGFHPQR